MRTDIEMLTLALPPKNDIYKERICQRVVGRISVLMHVLIGRYLLLSANSSASYYDGDHTACGPPEYFFGEDTSCSFRMSTPTTQAASTPVASAAVNTVVSSSAMTGSSLASTSVVTSTVTTPSSPKRTMSLGDYKKPRGNMVLARDELEALFDVGSDADMEDGEEEDEVPSSSTRVDPSVGSRRPREDDSDASGSKRSRSGSDRPLADAGPLSSPRSGGDST
ncbi:unnamed protein product [Phytophthora fragariaefolia]|uniref:Unnamed protein product n=1 Tax=Phytophthora fragariaefolia TaxID=1490495 RepID=A0A9W6YE79_9STRA|nr:unnamed protein product [Phytophthora fragariaefolia]